LWGVSFLSALPAHAVIYVSNSSFSGGHSITTWPNNTTGDIAPTTNIVGASTTFNYPNGVAVDANWIYVANTANHSVDVFPINATGDEPPTRSIKGNWTTLNYPNGVAVDADWIYVANSGNGSVDVFPINANGDMWPTRSIQGASTNWNYPSGVAVDASWIYVTSLNTDSVNVFQIIDNGDVAPTRLIQGVATTLYEPRGVAVDGSWIYVANMMNDSVDVFQIIDNGDVAPTRSIKGFTPTPRGVAVDASWIYVTTYQNNRVNVFPIGATGNEPPARSIQGAATTLNWPAGIAVTPAGPVDLPQTGQTTCYDAGGSVVACPGTGQDGDTLAGVAWPSPRFTDNGNGTVIDNLTGLIWLQDANCFSVRTWFQALSDANSLASGSCGLTDGSAAGDWRLANRKELYSLTDFSQYIPSLPSGHPFLNVQTGSYWSSSTDADSPSNAWNVIMYSGNVLANGKTFGSNVWPVRTTVVIPAPDITVTLSVLFGNVTEGLTSDQTVTVINDGNADLILGNIAVTDSLAAPFTILNDNCSGQTVVPATNCTFDVRFSPTAAVTSNDTFDIPSNDPDENPVTVSVSGTGTATGGSYSISGTVRTPSFGMIGSPISGVTMTLSGDAGGTTTTNSSGNYAFTGLANGSYTVTPGKAGYTFTPTSRAVTISGANRTGQSFTGN